MMQSSTLFVLVLTAVWLIMRGPPGSREERMVNPTPGDKAWWGRRHNKKYSKGTPGEKAWWNAHKNDPVYVAARAAAAAAAADASAAVDTATADPAAAPEGGDTSAPAAV